MKVLVVVAHADDETLGCGGTIAKHANDGDSVAVMCMTNGVGSRPNTTNANAEARHHAMESALSILGVSHHRAMDFPDNAMDSQPLLKIVKSVEAFSDEWGVPDIVYTHHDSDLNIDHQLTRRAVMTCFRPQPSMKGRPSRILSFEVLSSTGWEGHSVKSFHPTYFTDISSTLSRKLEALKVYSAELHAWPHARSLESVQYLARHRGAQVGIDAAEAFVVERILDREQ